MPHAVQCSLCDASFSSVPSRGTSGLAGMRLAIHLVEVHKLTQADAMLTAVDTIFTVDPPGDAEWPDEVVGLAPEVLDGGTKR